MRLGFNQRQRKILDLVLSSGKLRAGEIHDKIIQQLAEKISRPTVNRDIETLVELSLIEKHGSGPSSYYKPTLNARLMTFIDPNQYFSEEPDRRGGMDSFNWQIFDLLGNVEIFNSEELDTLKNLEKEYHRQRENLTETIIKKEIERVTIELSWKSSKIEGNTYTLLETENLLKYGTKAEGKTTEETQMIINHKNAIEYILLDPEKFMNLDVSKITAIHTLLIDDLNISKGFRKTLVGITGTNYKPIDNMYQIEEAMLKTIELMNNKENPFEKAILTMLLISYIQAFEDGNKRTSRIIGNAVLLSRGLFPLSFRNLDEMKYKEALILFYEQNNIHLFKKLFIEQSQLAVKNYFRSTK